MSSNKEVNDVEMDTEENARSPIQLNVRGRGFYGNMTEDFCDVILEAGKDKKK